MGLAHTGTNPLLVLELGRVAESTGPELRAEALQEAHRGDNLEIPPIPPLAQSEYGVQRNLASL